MSMPSRPECEYLSAQHEGPRGSAARVLQRKLPRRGQAGAASLAIAMLLLFAMTLVVFFVSRGLIFEQRSAANQYRATRAFETAEAGIEWALGMLNDRRFVAASGGTSACTVGSGTLSFRDRYMPSVVGAQHVAFSPVANVRVGCSVNGSALACVCPGPGTNPPLTGDDPAFTVELSTAGLPSGSESVRIVSRGCTSAGSQCVPGTTDTSDGYARIEVIAKLRPILRAMPSAALTVGGWAQLCSAFVLRNGDADSNGALVNAGGPIQLGTGYGSQPPGAPGGCTGVVQVDQTVDLGVTTLPGTPFENALIANDESLGAVSADPDAMFAGLFGTSLSKFKTEATTYVITGGDGAANAAALAAAYTGDNYTSFWVDGPLDFAGGYALGTALKPVLIASSGAMSFGGAGTIFGIVYADGADWSSNGSGNATVSGAVVARSNYRNQGAGSIVYAPQVLKNYRDDSGVLVRLPGSWKDF